MIAIPLVLLGALLGQVEEPPAGHPPPAGEEENPVAALVRGIRDNLQRIDEQLLDTADAEQIATGLQDVLELHRTVIRDLDELIRQARYRRNNQNQGGGGGGESQGSPQGQPPPRESDSQRAAGSAQEPGSTEENQAEERPAEGERPQNAGQEAGGAKQDPADRPPPPDPTGEFLREDSDGRWGLLPPKLQERLMNLHVDDVPERYRSWMEAYIRSLHALEQREAVGGARR